MSTVVLSPVQGREAKVTSDWMVVLSFLLVGGLLCAIFASWWPAFAGALTVTS
jgi:hypothetical protein